MASVVAVGHGTDVKREAPACFTGLHYFGGTHDVVNLVATADVRSGGCSPVVM